MGGYEARVTKAKRGGVRVKEAGAYHHGDLRRALVEAALAIVAKEGPAALTLRAAARLAGVTQTAPYRHFADKEALLAAVAEDGMRRLVAWMRRASAQHEAPGPRMQALGVAYARFAAAHASEFRVMFGPLVADTTRYPSLREATDEAFGLLREGVEACQRAKVVREGDARSIALAAWSIVHGLASLVVDGQVRLSGVEEKDTAELAQRMTEALFTGIGRRR